MSVSGWVVAAGRGARHRATSCPDREHLPGIAAQLAAHHVDGLLIIGGWAGYEAALDAEQHAAEHPELPFPLVCVPASIDNDLPASDMSIGADTALNSVMTDVDKIKDSAVGARTCFVVEVMGHDCGFLALMGGVTTGAERVHLPEEGISLRAPRGRPRGLREGFALRQAPGPARAG